MHAHDLGLAHDLAVMRQRWLAAARIDRRAALRLLGAAGAGLVLAACNGGDNDANSTTTTSPEATTSEPQGPTTTAGANGAATRSPSETGGPFPADGTNGPNVLDDSGVVRRDITTSFGEYAGTAVGAPLDVNLTIVRAGSGAPYAGAALYLWHCDAPGRYSLYSQGATNQNYCRGVQAADASGALSFRTIVPGCYPGRWPHFHYEVFPSLAAAGSAASRVLTSQIALPEEPCRDVYTDAEAYPDSAASLDQLALQSDGVFRDSYRAQLATMTEPRPTQYTLTYTVVV